MLRRAVYVRVESVRHEGCGLLNGQQRCGRRQKAGRPREQNGKVEEDADVGVPMVANLKRLDAEGTFTLSAVNGRSAFDKTPRQDFHHQQSDKDDRDEDAQNAALPIAGCTTSHKQIFHDLMSINDDEYICQVLPYRCGQTRRVAASIE